MQPIKHKTLGEIGGSVPRSCYDSQSEDGNFAAVQLFCCASQRRFVTCIYITF
jgi:hypothetical protein